jgi:2-desacetyl-2-hydroxyethyl bacteriochlorophyllide A dehydrogenase
MQPDRMKVLVIPGVGSDLVEEYRDIPVPGPGQVRVRVEAVGVCGSDLFLQQGGFGADKLPLVPGHEAAGVVDAVGDGVHDLPVGTQVALYYIENSPDAPRPNLGPDVRRMGVDLDGAFAEYVVRPAATVIPVPAPIPPAELAVLTDAVATPYHALSRVACLRPGEKLAVLGVGGIGSNAVQLGKVLGAHVVAISRGEQRRQLALSLGADEALTLDEAQAAHPDGFDVVIQCAASAAMDSAAIGLGGYGGRVVLVATTADPFTAWASAFVWKELEVKGSRGFTRSDIEAVIHLHAEGRIQTQHLTDSLRPLSEGNQALDDLRHGRVLRAVLLPGSSA